MNLYRCVGLAILTSCSMLAIVTYLLLGLNPLVALWIGMTIVGAAIASTPTEPLNPKHLVIIVNNMLANIAMVLEELNVKSRSVYVAYGDEAYIFITNDSNFKPPPNPPRGFFTRVGDSIALVFKSPIRGDMVEGMKDVCTAINYVVVELLDAADAIECVEDVNRVIIEVVKPRLSSPGRVERVLGSLYGVIAASIAALARGRPCSIDRDAPIASNKRRIVLRLSS